MCVLGIRRNRVVTSKSDIIVYSGQFLAGIYNIIYNVEFLTSVSLYDILYHHSIPLNKDNPNIP